MKKFDIDTLKNTRRFFTTADMIISQVLIILWRRPILFGGTEDKKKVDAMKNYDDNKIFLILNNENVSVIRNLQKRKKWNVNDTRKIQTSQQV